MGFIISALAFLVLLSILVLIHEWGHFFAARKAGVTVEEFGVGLPPRALTLFQRKGTIFSLNWIPFGGFVRLKGENLENERSRHAPGSFAAASIIARVAILVAGVAMNFLFAFFIFTIGFSVGRWIPTYVHFEELEAAAARGEVTMTPGVLIDEIIKDSMAEKAGVPALSVLTHVDGKEITSPAQVSPLQQGKKRVTYTLLTGPDLSQEKTVTVSIKDGKTGVSLRSFPRNLFAPARSPWDAFLLSLRETKVVTEQTVLGMRQLFLSLVSTATVPEGITGIVGIAELTHLSVQEGFMTYLRLVALLSLSLAVLNILPLPALDGGRLLFVIIEAIRRKPANRRFEVMTNMIGFMVLIFLILIITWNDISRLF